MQGMCAVVTLDDEARAIERRGGQSCFDVAFDDLRTGFFKTCVRMCQEIFKQG
jgi:hypothetical protein